MIQKIEIQAMIVLFASLFAPGASFAQQSIPVGEVDALEGAATIQRQGTFEHAPVRVGDGVHQQDFIQTSRNSKIRISLRDGTVLTMGQEGRLRLTRTIVDPDQSGRVILNFLTGALQVFARWLPSRRFELRTRTAAVGIRGTRFFTDARTDTTGILLIEGSIAVRNIDPRIQGAVTLAPSEGTDVAENLPPTAPSVWGAARRNALEQAATLP